jgi:cobalt/nickel transport system permease protein
MVGVHMAIGVGEGLITTGALAFLYATRRDLITTQESKPVSSTVWLVGLAIALGLAIVSPLASSHPDGLEWVAEQAGFLETALGAPYEIIPDYTFPGIASPELATILAGIVGTLLVGGVAYGIARARKGKPATG